MLRIEVDPQNSGDAIKPSVFGVDYGGWSGLGRFSSMSEEIGVNHIRWPGGIPAEDGIDVTGDGVRDVVYSLSYENLMQWPRFIDEADALDGSPSGALRPGLREMMGLAIDQNATLSIIIPTAHYAERIAAGEDPAAVYADIEADVSSFADRLLSGEMGDLPRAMIFEIGSEYYATDVWVEWVGKGEGERILDAYAKVFSQVAISLGEAFDEQSLASFGQLDFKAHIAVQMGRFQSAPDYGVLDGQYSDNGVFIQAYLESGAVDAVDSIIFHRYISNFDATAHGISENIYGHNLRQVVDEWEQAFGKDLSLVAGWASPDPSSNYSPIHGAPGLTSFLQLFSELTYAGVDFASTYGLGVDRFGSVGANGEVSAFGMLYEMLAESTVGLSTTDDFIENSSFLNSDGSVRADTVNVYSFTSSEKTVLYLASSDMVDGGESVIVDIAGSFQVSGVRTLDITDDTGSPFLINGTIVGGESDAFATEIGRDFTRINIPSLPDFQIVEITLQQFQDFGDFDFRIFGTSAEDVLTAHGKAYVSGGDGNDILSVDASGVHFDGGSGYDTVDLPNSLTGKIWISGGELHSADGSTFSFESIERIEFGDAQARLYVSTPNILVEGGNGGDVFRISDGGGMVSGGGGIDYLYASGDEDIFVFNDESDIDIIIGFDAEEDILLIDHDGVDSIDDLYIHSDSYGACVIEAGDDMMVLRGFDFHHLTEDNIAFI